MILISNLTLKVSDGSTIASTNIYSSTGTEDKKTYINIGSGNVFRLFWETPTLPNDTVDRYTLVIKRHDTTIDVYYDILDKNIGLVNEFYVDSDLLPALPTQYMLSIYIVAYGKNGSIITSNIENPYISKGSGTYVKVKPEGYNDSIMKRALAFVYDDTVQIPKTEVVALKDSSGRKLLSKDSKQLQAEVTNLLISNDWHVAQENYIKANDGSWHSADIEYEVLVDSSGNTITDQNNELIYVL